MDAPDGNVERIRFGRDRSLDSAQRQKTLGHPFGIAAYPLGRPRGPHRQKDALAIPIYADTPNLVPLVLGEHEVPLLAREDRHEPRVLVDVSHPEVLRGCEDAGGPDGLEMVPDLRGHLPIHRVGGVDLDHESALPSWVLSMTPQPPLR